MPALNSDLFWMPDIEEILRRRYRILKLVEEMANAGRRRIASHLDIPLSQVSKDTAVLCAMGLMVSSQGGFSVSREGRARLRLFEKENVQRVHCMNLEDRLRKCIPEAKIHVRESMIHIDVEAGRQGSGSMPIHPWSGIGKPLKQSEIAALAQKDAIAEAGGVVLSADGRPLYRFEKQERPASVWIRSEEGVTAVMIYAVIRYLKPEVLILTVEDADAVLELCMKERGRNACSCD